ncbi:MAG TPA: efflux RND transporter permease subunit [Gammaproteobacteria bacterium]|nr:efflux RND transporter permease subunit [Gammaproteobacteria bacterium]
MKTIERFYDNHVLANLVFALVLVVGALSYGQMPREQDPEINFNWIDITTIVPGMAASDIETQVTDVLEDALDSVSDVKFVSSVSRENTSSILVRFEQMPAARFDKRVIDLRREIQNKEDELPDEAESPFIFEVTTANAYPTAMIVVSSVAEDENLRRQAELVKKELERIKGVDRILPIALNDPEIAVDFDPRRLEAIGVPPSLLTDSIRLYYRDVSAGSKTVDGREWLVRLKGKSADPRALAALPLIGRQQEIRIGDVAEVRRDVAEPRHQVRYQGRPAVMLAVTKKSRVNTLDLIDRLNDYIARKNRDGAALGVSLALTNDSTEITRKALRIMQNNALLGLMLVLLMTWLFLGFRIAFLTTIGIPFILAGTFWLLQAMGHTLNVTVLLGVVISLGMLVDDAVVVVEGIYYRMQRGMAAMRAALEALREVAAPVTSAVLTTIAAFLPLMLLPGILGEFMKVIPIVVTTALAISLVEAFWMLPVHVQAIRLDFDRPSAMQRFRERALHRIRIGYTRWLIKAMRRPRRIIAGVLALFLMALLAAFAGQVNPRLMQSPVASRFLLKTDFFAADPLRLFYINVEMPNGTPLETTMNKVRAMETKIRPLFREGEVRDIVSYVGQMFTEMAPLQGARYGQIFVSLKPKAPDGRSVDEIVEALRPTVTHTAGLLKVYFLRLSGGPPTSRAISVKVRGDDIGRIREAVAFLRKMLEDSGFARDIDDDDSPGIDEMVLRVDTDAARRAGVTPDVIMRAVRLMVDGEIAVTLRDQGEEIGIRVRSARRDPRRVDEALDIALPRPDGGTVLLSTLVKRELKPGLGVIRHYNFRRTITLEADIDKGKTDTVNANRYLVAHWEQARNRFPTIDLDFSGVLDDINESIGAIGKLMLFGVLLMYAILGTQFRSYFQPMMILVTVPMAFTGVVMGLLVTHNPLSLYTLYGVVALAGIAVNAAIVLIDSANQRLRSGMSVLHATVYAARRRVIPILITSLTTVAGLFSLATGLGGSSLLWGPIATAIVWGLAVSTLLTLFVVPLLYRMFMRFSYLRRR